MDTLTEILKHIEQQKYRNTRTEIIRKRIDKIEEKYDSINTADQNQLYMIFKGILYK